MTDDQWAEIAHGAIKAIGFEREGMQPAAWVAVAHGPSVAGNQHIHIAASLVRGDGSRVDVWQSKKTLSRFCNEIERTYGLTIIEGREGKGMPGLTRAELEQNSEPARTRLARLVREASVASKEEAEFVRRLRDAGVLVRPRFETGGQEAVVGYSVALRVADAAKTIWFGGGKLARDLTLPHLRQFWEMSLEGRRDAVAEWRSAKSVAPDREAMLGGAQGWQVAADAVAETVESLQAIPVEDLAAWRGAAKEAAGVFAAWSRRYERGDPGPMARAAGALARSAQNRNDEPPISIGAVRDLRGVVNIVAQSELDNDSPMAWAMLVRQLGATLDTIGAAHVARGEAALAKALAGQLRVELEELHDRFETSPTRELVPDEQTFEHRISSSRGRGIENALSIDDDFDSELDHDFGL